MNNVFLFLFVVFSAQGMHKDLDRLQEALGKCHASQNSSNRTTIVLNRVLTDVCDGLKFLRFPLSCQALWYCVHQSMLKK